MEFTHAQASQISASTKDEILPVYTSKDVEESGGFGGTPGQAGFDAGNLTDYVEIPGSCFCKTR